MKGLTSEWMASIKPLPGGWITRTLLALVIALALAVDLFTPGQLDLQTPRGWVYLVLPHPPLIAVMFGAVPGAVVLLLTLGELVVLFATGASAYQIAQLSPALIIVVGLCAYMLPRAYALILSGTLAVLLVALIPLNPVPMMVATVAAAVIVVAASTAAGIGLGHYRRRVDRSAAEIADLREQQLRVRNEERRLLAHELHDIVAHDVTVIAMQARRAALGADPAKTAQILESIGKSAGQALADLRSMVLILQSSDSPAPVDSSARDGLDTPTPSGETTAPIGLSYDLDGVIVALERAGFDPRLTVSGDLALVPASLRQAIRRTIRELGTNVLKHADPAHPVEVSLSVFPDTVVIATANAPSTSRPVMSTHSGIEAMRARAEVFHGSITSGMVDGLWRTSMRLPLAGVRGGTQAEG